MNFICKKWKETSAFNCIGCDVTEVQDVVEGHLKDMILKHFDPKKADSIFTAAGQVTFINSKILICTK